MSLYFKDFARFLVCAVFSLNHQLLDGSSTGCTDSFLWCQCSVNTSSKKGNSSTCTSVKTCSQFCTLLAPACSLKGLQKQLKAFCQSFPPSQTWQCLAECPASSQGPAPQLHHCTVPYHRGMCGAGGVGRPSSQAAAKCSVVWAVGFRQCWLLNSNTGRITYYIKILFVHQ